MNKIKVMVIATGVAVGTLAGTLIGRQLPKLTMAEPIPVATSYSCVRPLQDGWQWDPAGESKKGFIPGESSLCTFTWENSDYQHFTIQINDKYVSGTESANTLSLVSSPRYWYAAEMQDGTVYLTTEGSKALSINGSFLRYYTVSSNYEKINFWTEPEMTAWLAKGCESQTSSFARQCLQNLLDPSSSEQSSSEQSSEESSESVSTVSSEESSEISESSSKTGSNDGSVEHPFTVSEAYAIAAGLAEGANNGQQCCIKGVIAEDPKYPDNPVYVKSGRISFYITDGEETLYVYNMNDEDNKATYTNDNKPQVGDEIIVAGALANYSGKLEICYIKNVANCYRVA